MQNWFGVTKGVGSENLGIDSLTVGIDKKGMINYREHLRIEVIKNTQEKIDDYSGVVNAITDCWQGESRDRFLRSFRDMRERIKNDLEQEYNDLEARLKDLENMYFKQDQNMIIE